MDFEMTFKLNFWSFKNFYTAYFNVNVIIPF